MSVPECITEAEREVLAGMLAERAAAHERLRQIVAVYDAYASYLWETYALPLTATIDTATGIISRRAEGDV